ncbi:hypothetical protein HDU93_003445 [Gonapodya sp. JEL0774]|nr:hypothetical protein HDU93_003445 [Gonapodya sp. JEL0774]
MDENKARAEKRKMEMDARMTDPIQLIRLTGTSYKAVMDAEKYYAIETGKDLSPWLADQEATVDRFDARNLLDLVPEEPVAASTSASQLTLPEEERISDDLNFERYRDLVDAEVKGRPEVATLQAIDAGWNAHLVQHSKAGAAGRSKNQDANDVLGSGDKTKAPAATPTEPFPKTFAHTTTLPSTSDVGFPSPAAYLDWIDHLPPDHVARFNQLGLAYGVDKMEKTARQCARVEEKQRRGKVAEERRLNRLQARRIRGYGRGRKKHASDSDSEVGGEQGHAYGELSENSDGSGSRRESVSGDESSDLGGVEFAPEPVPGAVEDISSAEDEPWSKGDAATAVRSVLSAPGFSARERLRKAAREDEEAVVGGLDVAVTSVTLSVPTASGEGAPLIAFKKSKRPTNLRGGAKVKQDEPVPVLRDLQGAGAEPSNVEIAHIARNQRNVPRDDKTGLLKSARRDESESRSRSRSPPRRNTRTEHYLEARRAQQAFEKSRAEQESQSQSQ